MLTWKPLACTSNYKTIALRLSNPPCTLLLIPCGPVLIGWVMYPTN